MGAITDFIAGPIFGSTGDAKKYNDSVTNWGDTKGYYQQGIDDITASREKALGLQSDYLNAALSGLNISEPLQTNERFTREALAIINGITSPYREAGLTALNGLQDFDPNSIQVPDVYDADVSASYDLAKEDAARALKNQLAAQGKYFSGGGNQLVADTMRRYDVAKTDALNTSRQTGYNTAAGLKMGQLNSLLGTGATMTGNSLNLQSGLLGSASQFAPTMMFNRGLTAANLYNSAGTQAGNLLGGTSDSMAKLLSSLGNLRYENSAGKHMLSLWGGQ